MAAEKSVSAGAVSLGNYLTGSAVRIVDSNRANGSSTSENSYSEQAFYPGANLTSSQRSKKWRSKSSSSDKLTSVAFDLGAAKTPGVFALVDTNLQYSATLGVANSILPSGTVNTNQVVLQGSSSSTFSTVQQFTYEFYQPDPINGVVRFYVNTDDSGAAVSAHRYWRVIFPDTSNGGISVARYFEAGEIWLGPLDEIRIEHNSISVNQKDQSPKSVSYSGAAYFDKLKTIRSITVQLKHVSDTSEEQGYTSSLALQEKMASIGYTDSVLLDISAYNTETSATANRKKLDVYYCKIARASWKASMQKRRSVALTFEESR
tara:strand:+ start:775 stop:1731 length:957 start_codon:yes stop_codon:yes gene_type:complete